MKTCIVSAMLTFTLVGVSGCRTAQDNVRDLQSTQDRNVTVGIVQREVRKGMSGAELAEVLGSPNIVTKDQNDKTTWVYDKIATEASFSQSQNALFLIIGGMSNQSGATSVTQRTLTVVIKMDANDRVESFTYHSSKF
jgi:outer membrane protein assembly factor BamE (lipoprotein component of BamABCDE complex)